MAVIQFAHRWAMISHSRLCGCSNVLIALRRSICRMSRYVKICENPLICTASHQAYNVGGLFEFLEFKCWHREVVTSHQYWSAHHAMSQSVVNVDISLQIEPNRHRARQHVKLRPTLTWMFCAWSMYIHWDTTRSVCTAERKSTLEPSEGRCRAQQQKCICLRHPEVSIGSVLSQRMMVRKRKRHFAWGSTIYVRRYTNESATCTRTHDRRRGHQSSNGPGTGGRC